MVTTSPNSTLEPVGGVSSQQGQDSQFNAALEKGREYLDSAVSAAKDKPWTAAAIGAGVVAATAATAYGATKLAQKASSGAKSNGSGNGRAKSSSAN